MRTQFAAVERAFHVVGCAQVVLGLIFVVFVGDVSFGVLLATIGVLTASRPWRDRAQYNAGWLAGRGAFVLSMMEAQSRGMRPTEWLIAEAERDGVVVRVIEDSDS